VQALNEGCLRIVGAKNDPKKERPVHSGRNIPPCYLVHVINSGTFLVKLFVKKLLSTLDLLVKLSQVFVCAIGNQNEVENIEYL